MATITRQVKISDDKVISVKVPEEWGANEIRHALTEKGLMETPSPRREVPTDVSATKGSFTDRPTESTGEGLGTALSGVLMSGLEKLDRPRAAVIGAATTALSGGDLEAIGAAAGRGITGKEHKLAGDFLFGKFQEEFKKPVKERNPLIIHPLMSLAHKYAPEETVAAMATLSGLVYDIAGDPITYTGVGLTSKGKNLTSLASLEKEGIDVTDPKMAKYIKDLVEKGEKLSPTLSGQFEQGARRVRVFGVPIPNIIAGKSVSLVEKSLEKVKTTKMGDDLWRMFSSTHGLKTDTIGFADIEERFKNVVGMARYHSVRDNIEVSKTIKDISSKTGISVDQINKFIIEGVEKGGVGNVRLSEISPESAKLLAENPVVAKSIKDLGDKNRFQLLAEQDAGIRLSELGASNRNVLERVEEAIMFAEKEGKGIGINPITGREKSIKSLKADREILAKMVEKDERLFYFKHAITPKAKKILEKEGIKIGSVSGGKAFSTQHASTLARKFGGKSVEEINSLARKGKLKGYEGIKFPDGFFFDDPALVQALRDINHRKAMAVVDLVNTTKSRFGVGLDDLRSKFGERKTVDELVELAGMSGFRQVRNVNLNTLTKGHAFPDEIATRLETHYDAFTDINKTNAFLSQYDAVQNWWKAYTLGIFPSYHFRNAVGNLWNNFVTGTTDVAVYGKANLIQLGKKGNIVTRDGRKISYDEIRDHLDELGVHNRGFIATDIEQALKTELGGARWLSLSKEAKAIHIGRKVGTAIENNSRIAKFIDELEKGKGTFDAAQEVKRALFDYQDLTKFEKSTMKRLMPFYTWSRKNIPLQVQEMVKNPGKYKAIDTLRLNIENTNDRPKDPNEYVLNEWMLNSYPTRVKWKEVTDADGNVKKLPTYFMLGGWLPAADIWKIISKPQQEVVNMLSPIISLVGEGVSGRDWFTWNELDSDIKTDFLGFRVGQPTKNALSNLRLLTTADTIAKNLGIYEKTKGIMPSPEKDMTAEETWLSFLTGIKTYTVDLEKERIRNMGKLDFTRKLKEKVGKQIFSGAKEGELEELINKVNDRELEKQRELIEKMMK